MSVKEFKVIPVNRKDIEDFIEYYHYSRSIHGVISDYCFGLYKDETLIGAIIYGRMAMANQWKRYSDVCEDVIELRRLVCIDDTPKNTESYFIGASLRWLKKNTKLKIVVSYSDLEYGHTGIVYKASNFTYRGFLKGAKVIVSSNGRKYHDKSLRSRYKGKLKPFALRLREELKQKEAQWITVKGKNVWTYTLT